MLMNGLFWALKFFAFAELYSDIGSADGNELILENSFKVGLTKRAIFSSFLNKFYWDF